MKLIFLNLLIVAILAGAYYADIFSLFTGGYFLTAMVAVVIILLLAAVRLVGFGPKEK